MTTRLLSPGDAAALLGLDRSTVERLMLAGRIPCVNVGTGKRRHLRASLETIEAYSRGERIEPVEKPEPLRLVASRPQREEHWETFEERFGRKSA